MNTKEFANGNGLFKDIYFKKHEQELLELADNGQAPKALFIGCSDSRVVPNLILQAKPGDLFIIRNVGNLVPPHKPNDDLHSTASAIEYAVSILNVEDIIVCGHSDCGAIKHLFEPKTKQESSLIYINNWLKLAEKAKSMALVSLGPNAHKTDIVRTTEKLSIITQLDNLMTYPQIKKRLEDETLYIHGWYYDVKSGNIDYYDPETYQFVPLESKNN